MTSLTMIGWKKIAIATGLGFLVIMGILAVISILRPPEISCVQIFPDGSSKTLFGKDCL